MVTDSESIRKLAEDLEKQELDVSILVFCYCWHNHNLDSLMIIIILQAPGGIPPSQVYAQLLAIYLYQNDL